MSPLVRMTSSSMRSPAASERAYESARSRHPDRAWPALQWYDLLSRVFRAEPIEFVRLEFQVEHHVEEDEYVVDALFSWDEAMPTARA